MGGLKKQPVLSPEGAATGNAAPRRAMPHYALASWPGPSSQFTIPEFIISYNFIFWVKHFATSPALMKSDRLRSCSNVTYSTPLAPWDYALGFWVEEQNVLSAQETFSVTTSQ